MATGQAVATLGHIVLVPLGLAALGQTGYGEWLVLYSTVAYMSALDFGVGASTTNLLTAHHFRGEHQRYRVVQHSSFALFALMAIAGTLLTGVVAAQAPLDRWLNITQVPPRAIAFAVLMCGVSVLGALPGGIVINAFDTCGRPEVSRWLTTVQRLVQLTGTAVGFALRWPIAGLAAVQLVSLIVPAAAWLYLRRNIPSCTPGLSAATREGLRALAGPSAYFSLLVLANVVSVQGSILAVAAVLGPASVALFQTTRTLANVSRQAGNVLSTAAWSELARRSAVTGDGEGVRFAVRMLTAGTVAAACAFCGMLWWVGPHLLFVWTGGEVVAEAWLLKMLMLHVVTQAPWQAASMVGLTSNRHAVASGAQIGAAVAGLAAGVLLMRRFGIAGLPAGMLVADALFCWHFVVRDACKLMQLNYSRYALGLWLGTASVASLSLLAAGLAFRYSPGAVVVQIVACAAAALGASAIASSWVFLTAADRRQVFSTAWRIVFRRGREVGVT